MDKKLYVGNLSYETTGSALEQMFAAFGTVRYAQVIMDRDACAVAAGATGMERSTPRHARGMGR
jgi:RNA recognition motif-containing protein